MNAKRDDKKIEIQYVFKNFQEKKIVFSVVFILSNTIRFLLDLINQHYSYFTIKFIYIVKVI